MKRLVLLTLLVSIPIFANDTPFDWSGLLGCGYINTDSCINEACAIVSGVNTHDDMLKASVKAVSKDATELGIKVGMTGAEAMELLR